MDSQLSQNVTEKHNIWQFTNMFERQVFKRNTKWIFVREVTFLSFLPHVYFIGKNELIKF